MPKGNRGPKAKEFIEQQFKAQGEITTDLSKKAIAVKLPVDVDVVVRSVPHMAAWLRRVITEAAQRELIQGDESLPQHTPVDWSAKP
jgi:hypothetical protein